MNFNLRVTNIFNFSNGHTVIVGEIIGNANLIRKCTCELRINNMVKQVINIEGENIVKKIDPTNKLRSLTTLENVELTKEEAQSGKWELVYKNHQ